MRPSPQHPNVYRCWPAIDWTGAIKQRYKQAGPFFVNKNNNPSETALLIQRSTKGVIFLNAIWLSIDIDNNSAAVLVDASPIFIVTRSNTADAMLCRGLVENWDWLMGVMGYSWAPGNGYPIPRGYDILLSLAGYHAPRATTHPIRYTTRPNLRQIWAHQDRLRICPARFSSTFSLPKQLLPKEAFSYIYIYIYMYNINIYIQISSWVATVSNRSRGHR